MKRRQPSRVRFFVAVVVLGTLWSSACATSARKLRGADLEPIVATRDIAGDPDVEAQLEILDSRTNQIGNDRFAQFNLHNRTGDDTRLAFNIEWYDRDGKPVSQSRRLWTPLELPAGASKSLRVRFPAPEAQSWRLSAVRLDEVR